VIGIFMGTIWAYDFFWLFFGPEMTQEERDEEAEDTRRYERLKREGMSLSEIGSARARGEFKDGMGVGVGMDEEKGRAEEREDVVSEHIEN
jgi:SHS family lactate transporter-like MFS transporter